MLILKRFLGGLLFVLLIFGVVRVALAQDTTSERSAPFAAQSQSDDVRIELPYAMGLPPEIPTMESLAQLIPMDLLAAGLFYGVMLVLAGYNLFLFISLREPVYLYLTLVILGFVGSKIASDGLGQEFLWSPSANDWIVKYSLLFAMFAASLFTTTFLELAKRAPKLNRAFNILQVAILAGALLVPFTNALLLGLIAVCESALNLISSWWVWRAGYRPARLLLASWLVPLIAALLFILSEFGLLPFPISVNNLLLVALAALVLFWSLALADRINLQRAEMQSANASLAYSERQYRSLFRDSLDAIFITTRTGEILDLNHAGLNLFGYTRAELAHLKLCDLFEVTADYERFQRTLEQANFVADFEARMRTKEQTILTALITSTFWQDQERGLSGYQGILRDVTEQRRTQAEITTYRLHLEELVAARTTQAQAELAERRRTEAALKHRVQELSALNEIAKTISTVTNLIPALALVAENVTHLFEVSATAIGEIDQASQSLRILVSFPDLPDAAALAGRSFTTDNAPILAQVVDANAPLFVPNAQTDLRLRGLRDLIIHFQARCLFFVPLRVSGVVTGILILSSTRADMLMTEEKTSLAETVGSALATAIENARLYQQAQATAIASERERLARELHDSVTQLLYSIVLLAGGWGMEAEQTELDRSVLAKYFGELADLGQQALGEMRLMLYQLRSPVLNEIGLSGAIQQRLKAVERRVGIQAQLYTIGDLDNLPLLVQEELYFIVQEALNNALRHAHATAVQIQLTKQNHHLDLVVHDNGSGFAPEQVSEGMGLRNMYARAQLIGANLTIHSVQDEGTRVHLQMTFETFDTEG